MLVNLKEILAIAEERKCAVGAFNTPNLECLIAVIDAAEKLGTPVIISHAELHENISPLEKIGPVMVQAAEKAGVPVNSVVLSGGIPSKNPLIVQIYTDVLNRPIQVCASDQACALGAAVLGTAAADEAITGYKDANEIAAKFAKLQDKIYTPDPEKVAVYDKLYAEYNTLMDYFGRGGNDVMKRLNRIREENK